MPLVGQLFTLSDFEWLACGGGADLSIVQNGMARPVVADRADRVPGRHVLSAYRSGATLLLTGLPTRWPSVGRLCRAIEYDLLEHGLLPVSPVTANAYLTPPQEQGFDRHHDDHSVLIVQLHGSKRWEVFRPGSETSALSTTLQAGDVLSIPRGHPHVAHTTDEASLHLTLGLHTLSRADALADMLREYEPFRRSITGPDTLGPALSDLPELDISGYLRDRRRRWIAGLTPLAGGQLVADAATSQVGPDTRVHRVPLMPSESDSTDGLARLTFPGGTLRLDGRLQPVFDYVAKAESFTPRQLPAVGAPYDAVELTRILIRNGIFRPATPERPVPTPLPTEQSPTQTTPPDPTRQEPAPTEALSSNPAPTKPQPSKPAPTETVPSKAAPTEAVSSKAAPMDVASSKVGPAEAVFTEMESTNVESAGMVPAITEAEPAKPGSVEVGSTGAALTRAVVSEAGASDAVPSGRDLTLVRDSGPAAGHHLGWMRLRERLSAVECDELIAVCHEFPLSAPTTVDEANHPGHRRAEMRHVQHGPRTAWAYQLIEDVAREAARTVYGFDLTGIKRAPQYVEYLPGNGHFRRHNDYSHDQLDSPRKITVIIQLSDPDAYRGGALQMLGVETEELPRERGSVLVFPSLIDHCVTPVTEGMRRALVAWVAGPRLR